MENMDVGKKLKRKKKRKKGGKGGKKEGREKKGNREKMRGKGVKISFFSCFST